jgi:hypothetical protein
VGKQPTLALDTTTVAGERAGLAYYAMAGNDDGHRISAVRASHRAYRRRTMDPAGELRIRQSRSAGDFAQRRPDRALKGSAQHFDGQAIDDLKLSFEVCEECGGQASGVSFPLYCESLPSILNSERSKEACFIIGPFDRAQLACNVGRENERADRCMESIDEQTCDFSHEAPSEPSGPSGRRQPKGAARRMRAMAARARHVVAGLVA